MVAVWSPSDVLKVSGSASGMTLNVRCLVLIPTWPALTGLSFSHAACAPSEDGDSMCYVGRVRYLFGAS